MPIETKQPLTISGRHLTVGELKAYLADLPDDLAIETQGCDCIGPCNGADVDIDQESKRAYLILTRDDSIDDDSSINTSN